MISSASEISTTVQTVYFFEFDFLTDARMQGAEAFCKRLCLFNDDRTADNPVTDRILLLDP